jgi:hypothetical protein
LGAVERGGVADDGQNQDAACAALLVPTIAEG